MKSILNNRSAILVRKSCSVLLHVPKTYDFKTSPNFDISRKYSSILSKFKCSGEIDRTVVRGAVENGTKYAIGGQKGCVLGACTVMYQVGSRDEVFDDLGATHFIRVCSMNNGSICTGFLKNRVLQQQGIYITVRTDRQCMAFTMICPPSLFEFARIFLIDTGASTVFADHDLAEVRRIIHNDLTMRPPKQHALDLLQTASFTGSLSNSIYCREERVDQMSAYKLNNFMKRCSHHKCSVGSWGLWHKDVVSLAEQLFTLRDPKSTTGCEFAHRSGFESYDTGPGSTTYVGLSVPSVGTNEMDSFLKHTIVASAMCMDGELFKQSGVMRHLSTALKKPELFTCQAFNLGYSDAGLFGFLLEARAEDAAGLSQKLVEFFQNCTTFVSKHDYENGKKRLKIGVSKDVDNCENAAFGLAAASAAKCEGGLVEILRTIDSVPVTELQKTAHRIEDQCRKGTMAVAVLGDVAAVPILNETDLKAKAKA